MPAVANLSPLLVKVWLAEQETISNIPAAQKERKIRKDFLIEWGNWSEGVRISVRKGLQK
ncbi:MAG: hypothetical protein FJY18_01900 [Bacteroidetes bacterium]|nr:hypothetical protein [Bacteroidota bacterium]